MNKRMKTRWLKALRSGKYEQGRDLLRSGDKFCCLGVLCDLYDKTRWTENYRYKLKGATGTEDVYAPGDVEEAVGLDRETQAHLTKLNDGFLTESENIKRKSFKQIANYIEKHL